jgi:nucleoside-diphosphate-sugar epimerase
VRVLVTGSDGYIGSVLGPFLAAAGHDVVGLDTGFYRSGWLYDPRTDAVPTVTEDIRNLGPEDFEGIEAVVHMAELSNDPVGQLSPTITYDINHAGSVQLATTARAAGVERFVYTSSCSVYGDADEEMVDEESPLKPQTAYARCKELVENDVSALATSEFTPVFLRNATAYGASPRLRFDVVLNNLCGFAWTTREIRMESDGTPWRPLVHVLDVSKAILCVLEAPREDVHGQVLNVGDRNANFQVRELAEIVGRVFPDCEVSVGQRGSDRRSYRVSFAKIHELLPSFACEWTPELGAAELLDVFRAVELTEVDFTSRSYTRLKQIEYLLRSGQIDDAFFWQPLGKAVAETAVQT